MTNKKMNSDQARELRVLEALQQQPELRQVDLASRLGLAAGTANWLIKRLISKGYVKAKRIGQWRWRYLLTPEGFAAKALLTQRYLQESMQIYRETRHKAQRLINELRDRGCTQVYIEGDPGNDLVDVCRLTCLEQGIKIVHGEDNEVPELRVDGREVAINWPREKAHV